MLKIEVKEARSFQKKVTRRSDGKQFEFKVQAGYAHLPGKPYPVEIEIGLGEEQAPYPAGDYQLGPDSIYVDRYGSLALGRITLLPLAGKRVA